MKTRCTRAIPVALLVILAIASCKGAPDKAATGATSAATAGGTSMSGMAMGATDIPPDADYTAADVEFMQGMIAHHAQALVMTAMAPTHGANPSLAILCKRMYGAQSDEINLMVNWLKDRHQPVPDPKDAHPMMMPGMLTAEQISQLDAARDTTWDRLFLRGMIQHHEGALKMVADLFASPRGGQGADLFAYATGVDAGQRVEITIMQHMLDKAPTRSSDK